MPGELTERRRLAALTKPQLIDEVISMQKLVNGADHTAAKYWRRVQEVEREMRARELHHFEEEQKSAELAAVIERVRVNLSDAPECDEHPDDDPITCGWKSDMIHVRKALDTAPADALRQVKAEAFDEGAQFAWGESGEGWNGEYPPGESPDFASHNPYRQEQTDGE